MKVDPITGEPSSAPNAITYATFQNHKPVDPITGEPSSAPNAITYSAFWRRKNTHQLNIRIPVFGELSDEDNAFSGKKRIREESLEASVAIPTKRHKITEHSEQAIIKPIARYDLFSYCTCHQDLSFFANKKTLPTPNIPHKNQPSLDDEISQVISSFFKNK